MVERNKIIAERRCAKHTKSFVTSTHGTERPRPHSTTTKNNDTANEYSNVLLSTSTLKKGDIEQLLNAILEIKCVGWLGRTATILASLIPAREALRGLVAARRYGKLRKITR